MAFVKVATVQEVPAGKSKQVKVGSKTIALFNVDGTFRAIDDTCPHRGAPLWEGAVAGEEVTCPWHAARFNLSSGAVQCPPARGGLPCYKVQVVGDAFQTDVP